MKGRIAITAFNTLMFGCDEKKWNDLTDKKVAQQFGNAAMVKLNGPRFWTMDTVSANSSLIDPKLTYIGDIKMIVVGIVKASYYDVLMKLVFNKVTNYIERHVNRHTVYVFRANELVYIMTSPVGKTYIMQSGSAQYDTTLNIDNLKDLGKKLNPPAGWSYKVVRLEEDLYVPAPNSIGTLINDEFFNSYSLFDSALLDNKVKKEEGSEELLDGKVKEG